MNHAAMVLHLINQECYPESEADVKWQGGVQLVIEAPIEKVWKISSDKCGVPRWMPMIESCEVWNPSNHNSNEYKGSSSTSYSILKSSNFEHEPSSSKDGTQLSKVANGSYGNEGSSNGKVASSNDSKDSSNGSNSKAQCKDSGSDGNPIPMDTTFRRIIRGDILPRIDGEQSWAIERLLEMDEDNYYYMYTVDASNIGMEGYTATFQLNDFGDGTTLVSWFYEVDPMFDSSKEAMADYMSMFFKSCIKRLEHVCNASTNTTYL